MTRRARRPAWGLLAACVAFAAWAAFAPVPRLPTRERAFVIPEGTWKRRMAGEAVEILPQRIDLTLGINDVLRLENHDVVPQTFGPALLMPGQSFRLPFQQASNYQFACSAHASGQMTVVVAPFPASPWQRLQWRLGRVATGLQDMMEQAGRAMERGFRA